MRALDATVETVRPDASTRAIPMAAFHRLPGQTPQIETVLEPGETITGGPASFRRCPGRISIGRCATAPPTPSPLVSVAAVIDHSGGKIRSARLAFGGLAHQPWRVPAAEQDLEGAAPGNAAFEQAADTVLQGARGYGSNDFKIPLTRRVLRAVLTQATTQG